MPHSKKRRHQTKGSETPGRIKTATCKADWRKKHFAKHGRAYRDPEYPAYIKAIDRESGRAA